MVHVSFKKFTNLTFEWGP